MPHAAIGRNEAAAYKLARKAIGGGECTAEQNGEGGSGHGKAHSAKARPRKSKKTEQGRYLAILR
ncbi:hypothetical protein D3C72_2233800 [compost metagenome]